eukprot:CAMPEP_0176120526 /NCGR_PEP_ID=MMETSP0120_2-20121206/60627_1 /TAXON_ID=160619 /ORGANISM="Kryptoperidinium foliaceum, Strain CCMP 1326" /LENGTH=69 /DNA_ID=CAMNT_0017454987 /DNA_START=30 /DNA_END=239 /DNA_ORIENTATION=+
MSGPTCFMKSSDLFAFSLLAALGPGAGVDLQADNTDDEQRDHGVHEVPVSLRHHQIPEFLGLLRRSRSS